MAGPGSRYLHMAIEIAKYTEVILFTPNECNLNLDFKVFKISKGEILKQIIGATSIIIQGTTLWEHAYLKKMQVPLVIDLYCPFVLENLELNYKDANAQHRASLAILLDQLQYGDFFICASEKQKDFWLGMLLAINRVNPLEYKNSKVLDNLIDIVPFGLLPDKPIKSKNVLKGIIDGIANEDKVIIWAGGIWNWLDPLTAIKAISLLCKKRTDIKLFFMGTKHPNPDIVQSDMVKSAVKLSNDLGLTNKYVFFNEWVDYHERHNYLLESDIGISLHFNHLETRFSFRTRILDHIWCGLPTIATHGDVMSQFIEEFEIGVVVPSQDVEQVAQGIETILEKTWSERNFKDASDYFHWSRVFQPLIRYCCDPRKSLGKEERIAFKDYRDSKLYFYGVKGLGLLRKGDFKKLISKLKRKIL